MRNNLENTALLFYPPDKTEGTHVLSGRWISVETPPLRAVTVATVQALHFVGFNGLFFPGLKKQQLALARVLTEVRKICHVFSAASPDHNYTVHVQISCKVILPPGVTRFPQIKDDTYWILECPSALARQGWGGRM